MAGAAVGGGEGAVFFGAVVADGVESDDSAVAGDLDRVGHDGDLGAAATPSVADPVGSAREREVAGGVDDPRHHHAVGGSTGAASALPQVSLLPAAVEFSALHVLATSTSRWKIRTRCSAATASTGSPASTIGTR